MYNKLNIQKSMGFKNVTSRRIKNYAATLEYILILLFKDDLWLPDIFIEMDEKGFCPFQAKQLNSKQNTRKTER